MDVQITTVDVGHIRPRWLKEQAQQEIIVPPEARIMAPITLLRLHGPLDGAGYQTLVEVAHAEINGGAARIILDLTHVEKVTSAGVLGLYVVGALLDGTPLIDLDGYGVMDGMRDAIDRGEVFPALAVAAPADAVARALNASGLDRIVACHPSLDDALSDFPDP